MITLNVNELNAPIKKCRVAEYIKKKNYPPICYQQETLFTSKDAQTRSAHCCAAEMNPTSIHEDACSIPGLSQWVKDRALS